MKKRNCVWVVESCFTDLVWKRYSMGFHHKEEAIMFRNTFSKEDRPMTRIRKYVAEEGK